MVNVAKREESLRAHGLGHFAHQFGYGFLFIVSVAAQVVAYHQRDVAGQPGGRNLSACGGYGRKRQKCGCKEFTYHGYCYFAPNAPKCGSSAGE